jgi:uncharacterized protein YqgC (DUF456 family)
VNTGGLDGLALLAWLALGLGFVLAAVGTVIPGLPGAAFVLLALLVHHWILPDFYPLWTIWVIAGLTLLSGLADLLAVGLGAKWGGASRWGLLGAALGALVGLAFGPLGLLAGPFFGAILGDALFQRREWRRLFKAGAGAALGTLLALVLRFAILTGMAAVLLGTAFWRLSKA